MISLKKLEFQRYSIISFLNYFVINLFETNKKVNYKNKYKTKKVRCSHGTLCQAH